MRSPAPQGQLLCVKCGRDTTVAPPVTNGTDGSTSTGVLDALPNNYHPLVNGDDMDSDEEEQEAGVMEVETSLRLTQSECISPPVSD